MIITKTIKDITKFHSAGNMSWTVKLGTKETIYFLGIPIYTKKTY